MWQRSLTYRLLQCASRVTSGCSCESLAAVDSASSAICTTFKRSFAAEAAPLLKPRVIEAPPRHDLIPPLEARKPTPLSRRTGVIAIKVGMTQEWDAFGVLTPLTVLWLDDCRVVQVKTPPYDCTTALQIGCGFKRDKNLNGRELGHFRSAGLHSMRALFEFPVTPDALLPVGTPLTAAHFCAGQYVDVRGITIGKGFQGVMKRWGFKGGPASHGNSLAHRTIGSTGANKTPSRTFKGQKMAGHMGNQRRTVHNLWLHKVDAARGLLYVKGSVPGHKGNFVLVRDAIRHGSDMLQTLPFPTHLGDVPEVAIAEPRRNRFDLYNQED